MLPGKARRLPVPMRFADQRGAECRGDAPGRAKKHGAENIDQMLDRISSLDAPMGMEKPDRATVRATSMAAVTSFFVLISLCFAV